MHRHQRRAHPLVLSPGRRRARRGLTLVELMLSGALGVVVMVAAVAMLMAAGRMRRNQQLLSDANEEARTALRYVTRGLASAGAGGPMFAFVDAGPSVRQGSVIAFKNGTTPLADPEMPQTPDELVLVRYLSDRRTYLVRPLGGNKMSVAPDPRPATVPGVLAKVFEAKDLALVTNFKRAMLLPISGSTLDTGSSVVNLDLAVTDAAQLQDPLITIQPGASVFSVQVVRYRVVYRPKTAQTAARADLVMETIDPKTLLDPNPPPVTTVVLARDIEDFQVQWAFDRDEDGAPDAAFDDKGPSASYLDPALSFARLSLSARTSSALIGEAGLVSQGTEKGKGLFIPGAKDLTPFELGLDSDLGGKPKAKNEDGYRHRVMSTVVMLKNVAAPRL